MNLVLIKAGRLEQWAVMAFSVGRRMGWAVGSPWFYSQCAICLVWAWTSPLIALCLCCPSYLLPILFVRLWGLEWVCVQHLTQWCPAPVLFGLLKDNRSEGKGRLFYPLLQPVCLSTSQSSQIVSKNCSFPSTHMQSSQTHVLLSTPWTSQCPFGDDSCLHPRVSRCWLSRPQSIPQVNRETSIDLKELGLNTLNTVHCASRKWTLWC